MATPEETSKSVEASGRCEGTYYGSILDEYDVRACGLPAKHDGPHGPLKVAYDKRDIALKWIAEFCEDPVAKDMARVALTTPPPVPAIPVTSAQCAHGIDLGLNCERCFAFRNAPHTATAPEERRTTSKPMRVLKDRLTAAAMHAQASPTQEGKALRENVEPIPAPAPVTSAQEDARAQAAREAVAVASAKAGEYRAIGNERGERGARACDAVEVALRAHFLRCPPTGCPHTAPAKPAASQEGDP
jgi:hypothetical protein